jgi:hypothetical protein
MFFTKALHVEVRSFDGTNKFRRPYFFAVVKIGSTCPLSANSGIMIITPFLSLSLYFLFYLFGR